ncbi:dienelactone hydrolase family protein [Nocardioides zeae]|uniref:Dienelactone hydrolase family protein n=1 Tax=Nocardioides zeae TaxID=1457234 RepID=A0A6P0HM17_9ACTN|nr:dienelactone hydrolase family protein [Nocardioides zeae]NEN79718.1 dienelactone hydrolase family protein [Nocardioides zeae]
MQTAVTITPRRERWAHAGTPLDVAELYLGGIPRGAVLVLCAEDQCDGDDAVVLNALAEHGYEGLAATPHGDVSADALVAAAASLSGRLAARGWEAAQIGVLAFRIPVASAMRLSAATGAGALVTVSPVGLTADARGELDAALPPLVSATRSPWLVLSGEEDPAAPASALTDLSTLLAARGPRHSQVVRYPGVGADLYLRSTEPLELAASFDHRQRIIEWFNAQVEPRPTPLAVAWRERRGASSSHGPLPAAPIHHADAHDPREEGAD